MTDVHPNQPDAEGKPEDHSRRDEERGHSNRKHRHEHEHKHEHEHEHEHGREHEHKHGHEREHEHKVMVTVNEQPVLLEGKSAIGAEIKSAAIAQGVLIQQNFVLQEELPNGTSRVIGDADVVHLREHLRFTAIAPDDNS